MSTLACPPRLCQPESEPDASKSPLRSKPPPPPGVTGAGGGVVGTGRVATGRAIGSGLPTTVTVTGPGIGIGVGFGISMGRTVTVGFGVGGRGGTTSVGAGTGAGGRTGVDAKTSTASTCSAAPAEAAAAVTTARTCLPPVIACTGPAWISCQPVLFPVVPIAVASTVPSAPSSSIAAVTPLMALSAACTQRRMVCEARSLVSASQYCEASAIVPGWVAIRCAAGLPACAGAPGSTVSAASFVGAAQP